MPSVNGEVVPLALFEQRLQANVARGQSDSSQLREAIKQDLIYRQLLLKEAKSRGTDKDADFVKQLAVVRDDMLVEWFLHKQSDPAAISAAELKAEYERQVQALGPAADLREYQLRLIALPSRETATGVIKALQNGEAFEKLARDKSVDASREQGGLVGWVLPMNVTPTVASVMANLVKGAISVVPIETPTGWAVIRVDDARPYKVPSIEESRDRLIQAVVMRKRVELIRELQKTADIKR